MRSQLCLTLLALSLFLAPTASWGDLTPYSQDFEWLDQGDPGALGGDGWKVFGNVWDGDAYLYGYGVFSAPNGGPGFSAIRVDEGGPEQGLQQMVVYNDYNDPHPFPYPHEEGWLVEANVFQEQVIGVADVGTTWRFEFDARRFDIDGDTTAAAFFKTLDPNNGWALTNFIPLDMTNVPATWDTYSLSIYIDPGLVGQYLQFGFLNTTTYWQGSGILYDNVAFGIAPLAVNLDLKPGGCPNPMNNRSAGWFPVAVLGTADLDVNEIDVSSLRLEGLEPVQWDYQDEAGPFEGDLCGCTEAGPDGFGDLTLKFDTLDLLIATAMQTGTVPLTLTGTLLDGTAIEGQDCIVFVGRGGRSSVVNDPALIDRLTPPTTNGTGPVRKTRSGER